MIKSDQFVYLLRKPIRAICFSDKYDLPFQGWSFDVELLVVVDILLEVELLLEVEFLLGAIHKYISSDIADFFCYFLKPLSLLLSGLRKLFSKVSLSNTQYEKYLKAKSSLKQI